MVEIRTELHPLVLMDKLLEVENAMGRRRADAKTRDPKKPGTAARVIDCDLVWVEGETHHGAKLTLPHPAWASATTSSCPWRTSCTIRCASSRTAASPFCRESSAWVPSRLTSVPLSGSKRSYLHV